jgi:general stress protein 26
MAVAGELAIDGDVAELERIWSDALSQFFRNARG